MEKEKFGFIVVSTSTYDHQSYGHFYVHETYEEALEEAKKLCAKERTDFCVYKPVALVGMVDVQVTEL